MSDALHEKLWMPRPVDPDEPGWVLVDFGFTPEEWAQFEAKAREQGLPVNVWIRTMIYLGLRAVMGDVDTKGIMHDEQLPPWAV